MRTHERRFALSLAVCLGLVALLGGVTGAWSAPGADPRPQPALAAAVRLPVERLEPVAPRAEALAVSEAAIEQACVPATDLSEGQVVAYYGNPYTPQMGILGELEPEELIARLEAHAAVYDALNGPRPTVAALHIVYGTAQREPGDDGLYLSYVDDATLQEYIDLACEHGMLVFLDLQIGRSDVATEVQKALPFLNAPHVHLALDPEFAMPPGERPGETIGFLDADDINEAQSILQRFVMTRDGLPDKALVVHQFMREMIVGSERIADYPGVDLVINMDGFGPAEIKRTKYGWYAAPAERAGIKLFFGYDPDLMTEADVVALDPDVVIYQ